MDDDESLSAWAERLDRKIGRLRAVPLVAGDGPRGTHLAPDAPRVIQRWNGHEWEPHGSPRTSRRRGASFTPTAAPSRARNRLRSSGPGRAGTGSLRPAGKWQMASPAGPCAAFTRFLTVMTDPEGNPPPR